MVEGPITRTTLNAGQQEEIAVYLEVTTAATYQAVSYTHLDVYKRQLLNRRGQRTRQTACLQMPLI